MKQAIFVILMLGLGILPLACGKSPIQPTIYANTPTFTPTGTATITMPPTAVPPTPTPVYTLKWFTTIKHSMANKFPVTFCYAFSSAPVTTCLFYDFTLSATAPIQPLVMHSGDSYFISMSTPQTIKNILYFEISKDGFAQYPPSGNVTFGGSNPAAVTFTGVVP